MTRSPLQVVCDAGPLIHLDELGCLDLLADFQAVLVPEQVWQEVGHHRPDALRQRSVDLNRVRALSSQFKSHFRRLLGRLHWTWASKRRSPSWRSTRARYYRLTTRQPDWQPTCSATGFTEPSVFFSGHSGAGSESPTTCCLF